MTNPAPYCGDLAMAFDLRPQRDAAAGGVTPLFAGRRVNYSFNTRVAIRKAVDLLGLKPGDEVLAPAYNCGSELDPLRHAGLSIRLYPITAATGIDPNQLESMIGPRTRAIYMTHYFGFLQPETSTIRNLCDEHGLHLIEDCALSLLSGDAPAEGRAGDISVFCFYKFFPVLAGGALVINSDKITTGAAFARPARARWLASAYCGPVSVQHSVPLAPQAYSAASKVTRMPTYLRMCRTNCNPTCRSITILIAG